MVIDAAAIVVGRAPVTAGGEGIVIVDSSNRTPGRAACHTCDAERRCRPPEAGFGGWNRQGHVKLRPADIANLDIGGDLSLSKGVSEPLNGTPLIWFDNHA